MGSNLFPEGHAPHYWMGYSLCLVFTAAAIGGTFVLKGMYERMNEEKRRVEGENPGFRYVL